MVFFALNTYSFIENTLRRYIFMSTYFKHTFLLTDEEKKQVSEMDGKIMLWILEGRSLVYMAEKLHLQPWQVVQNVDEMLYTLKRQIGWKRYLKILFWR